MESKDWSGFGYLSPNFNPGMPVSQRIWTPPPPSKSAQRIWAPLRRFGPSYQTFLLSILCIILVTNSICKLFVDVLFNHNTTFLNKGKKKTNKQKNKQPFHSNSTAFIIVSHTVDARIRCEQTTAFELSYRDIVLYRTLETSCFIRHLSHRVF